MSIRKPGRLLCNAGISLASTAVLVLLLVNCMASRPVAVVAPVAYAAAAESTEPADASARPDEIVALAQRDPMGLIRRGEARYERDVRDYRCTFLKQEKLPDGMTPVQEIAVLYRRQPTSVYMTWNKNEGKAKRALWIDEPAFKDQKGNRLAKVEPAGAVLRLVISDVMMPIHGKDAREQSRRGIDEFGFGAIFKLLTSINEKAAARGVLDFKYDGEGEVDGRPTLVLRRILPPDETGAFPDQKMVLHVDREWLLPVAVYSYADAAGTDLLGSYVMTDVELNPGLKDESFKF